MSRVHWLEGARNTSLNLRENSDKVFRPQVTNIVYKFPHHTTNEQKSLMKPIPKQMEKQRMSAQSRIKETKVLHRYLLKTLTDLKKKEPSLYSHFLQVIFKADCCPACRYLQGSSEEWLCCGCSDQDYKGLPFLRILVPNLNHWHIDVLLWRGTGGSFYSHNVNELKLRWTLAILHYCRIEIKWDVEI